MTDVKPATDEQVARFKVRAVIGALWSDEALSLIARIDADREELSNLRQAKFWWVEQEAQLRAQIAALKAEVERLTPAFLPCHSCGGKGFSDIVHGSVVLCDTCHGTGRAR